MSETKRRTVVVANPQGLHLRPLEQVAALASQYDANVELVNGSTRADASSIMSMLALGSGQGTELTIEATGADAQAAVDAMAELLSKDFGEEESGTSGEN